MPDHKKFECFKQTLIQENEAAYGPELRARYGGGTIDAANDLFMSRSREEYDAWTALGEEIQEKLEAAVQAGADPAGAEGRALALLHRKWCAFRWPGAAGPRVPASPPAMTKPSPAVRPSCGRRRRPLTRNRKPSGHRSHSENFLRAIFVPKLESTPSAVLYWSSDWTRCDRN